MIAVASRTLTKRSSVMEDLRDRPIAMGDGGLADTVPEFGRGEAPNKPAFGLRFEVPVESFIERIGNQITLRRQPELAGTPGRYMIYRPEYHNEYHVELCLRCHLILWRDMTHNLQTRTVAIYGRSRHGSFQKKGDPK